MKAKTESLFLVHDAIMPSLGTDKPHDLLVKDGLIAACGPCGTLDVPADTSRFDAKKQRLYPSFTDAHAHFREPGQEYKEDIASGLAAAAHGGFGAVMVMANTSPVNDSASITRFMLEQAKASHPDGPRLLPIGALTIGLEGKELAPFGELTEAGCAAFSNDGKPVSNTEIFRRGMEYAAQWGKVVIDHCEDEYLAKGSHMNEGAVSGLIGVKGQPTVAEALHVARDILLAEYLDIHVHLAHISCRQSLDLIRFAKAKGVKVSAEACPHHLMLHEGRVAGYDTAAKVNPPLRSEDDVAALRDAVRDGTIDIFATDHAPHAAHEKEHPLDEAPNGMIGLETALPLTYDLVRQGVIDEARLIHMWTCGPGTIFSLPDAKLAVGNAANFFLFDPDQEWLVSRENLHSKSINTPFLGCSIRGKVTAHWLGANKIV